MSISRWLGLTTLASAVVAGSACTQDAVDRRSNEADAALESASESADKALDATRDGVAAAGRTAEAALSATGEAITDGWITTKVNASFVDESLLNGSDINVDTDDHVVTLKGTVRSDLAKARAATVARGIEGVTRVVNQLVIKAP